MVAEPMDLGATSVELGAQTVTFSPTFKVALI